MPGPPPPPPPMMAPVKKFTPAAPSGGGGDPRNALLGQIQKGKALKKVTTVDKSTPIGVGKIAGEPAPSPSRSRGPATTRTSPDTATSSPISGKKPPGGFANITDELQFKLTLKKNKTSPTKETSNVTEAKEVSVVETNAMGAAKNSRRVHAMVHHLELSKQIYLFLDDTSCIV